MQAGVQVHRQGPREALVVIALLAATAALVIPMPSYGDTIAGNVLLTLLIAAVAIEALPINFPDRAGVTLTVLPAALLWHYSGVFAASVAAGAAVAIVHRVRQVPEPVLSGAVAISSVWIADIAWNVVRTLAPHYIVTATPWVGTLVFGVTFSLVAPVFAALLMGRDNGPFEPISSLIMTPLAITLIELVRTHPEQGAALLPLLMISFGGILLLVRSNVNVSTLHHQVAQLARRNEEIAQALAVERDAIAAIVAYSGDGIFTVDPDLHIRRFNPALAAIVGRSEESALGRTAAEMLGPGHSPAVVGALLTEALREGRAMRVDSSVAGADGPRELRTSYSAIPGPDGSVALGVGVVHDVTQEREEARVREDYFSLVTHDLRNPLTAIVGNTHLLDREVTRTYGEGAPVRRMVGQIEQANGRLLRLVNNLLELQRIEGGQDLMDPECVALRPLLDDLAAEFAGDAAEKRQHISVAGSDLEAWADPTWVREIVTNLLSNAIKYTPAEGSITLSVAQASEHTAIEVADTGYGLVPGELDKLFTKFFRSKRPEVREARGSGLGLALAKRMAERMGGDITVRSTVGVGSVFTVVLPSSGTRGAISAPPNGPVPGGDPRAQELEALIMSLSRP